MYIYVSCTSINPNLQNFTILFFTTDKSTDYNCVYIPSTAERGNMQALDHARLMSRISNGATVDVITYNVCV